MLAEAWCKHWQIKPNAEIEQELDVVQGLRVRPSIGCQPKPILFSSKVLQPS